MAQIESHVRIGVATGSGRRPRRVERAGHDGWAIGAPRRRPRSGAGGVAAAGLYFRVWRTSDVTPSERDVVVNFCDWSDQKPRLSVKMSGGYVRSPPSQVAEQLQVQVLDTAPSSRHSAKRLTQRQAPGTAPSSRHSSKLPTQLQAPEAPPSA